MKRFELDLMAVGIAWVLAGDLPGWGDDCSRRR